MTLEDEVTLLDPFTHTKQDHDKIMNFDFYKDQATEKIRIVETFCTVVTVSGKYLEKNTFKSNIVVLSANICIISESLR